MTVIFLPGQIDNLEELDDIAISKHYAHLSQAFTSAVNKE